MNVEVTVNGHVWTVALEPAGPAGTYAVTVKGQSRRVDASWIDAGTLSLIDGGAAREIRFHTRADNGAVGVEVDGTLFEAAVQKRNRDPFSALSSAKKDPDSFSGAAIKAPMPGRVVRVLVAAGDRVVARQAVVVVEAMKMENELRAPRDGVVKDVLVLPGAAVESGAVLVVVEDQ
jgi:biotin carboxyl carrier protein